MGILEAIGTRPDVSEPRAERILRNASWTRSDEYPGVRNADSEGT